jgi:hypothetical protein
MFPSASLTGGIEIGRINIGDRHPQPKIYKTYQRKNITSKIKTGEQSNQPKLYTANQEKNPLSQIPIGEHG